jgi:hypothetical protein
MLIKTNTDTQSFTKKEYSEYHKVFIKSVADFQLADT